MLKALEDANLGWADIQALYCASAFGGMGVGQNVATFLGLTGIPIVNVENACASSLSAFRLAFQSVASGLYDVVGVMGVDKMPGGFIALSSEPWQRKVGYAVTPAYMALNCKRYMHDHGMTAEHLALVSAKNHKNSTRNPYAMYRKEYSTQEILNAKMVCDPLTIYMFAPVNEGAGAAILCSEDIARKANNLKVDVMAVTLASPLYGEVSGSYATLGALPMICSSARLKKPSVSTRAAAEAYRISGIGPDDVDVAELNDGSSWDEIQNYEAMGFCKEGEGYRLAERNATSIDGEIPVNPSGGMESKGDPVGPTSLGQIAEIVWQLRGKAEGRQINGAKIGLAQSAGAASSGVVILNAD